MSSGSLEARFERFQRQPSAEEPVALAKALIEADHPRRALQVLSTVRAEGPDEPEVLLVAGEAWLRIGDLVRAQRSLTRAAELVPADSRAYELLSEVLIARGDLRRSARARVRAENLHQASAGDSTRGGWANRLQAELAEDLVAPDTSGTWGILRSPKTPSLDVAADGATVEAESARLRQLVWALAAIGATIGISFMILSGPSGTTVVRSTTAPALVTRPVAVPFGAGPLLPTEEPSAVTRPEPPQLTAQPLRVAPLLTPAQPPHKGVGAKTLLNQGFAAFHGGDDERARSLAQQAVEAAADDTLRARAWFLLGRIDLREGKRGLARQHLQRASEFSQAPVETWFYLGEARAGVQSRAAREAYERYLKVVPDGPLAKRARRALR